MSFIKKRYGLMLLYILPTFLLFLSGCNEAAPESSPSIYLKIPTQPVTYKFDLSARQQLRDVAGEFSVRERGADTGITVLPDEKVEIFASGSSIQPGGRQSGPEGIPSCPGTTMPESSLPCYSVIYSIGINGGAGEVGRHVAFNPTTIGNLFLGVNASNLASNAGSFHIMVFIIPPGKLTGLWTAPKDAFLVQGTTMALSIEVFAQNTTINNVEFTAALPGQAPVPVCKAFTSGGDTYSCEWDFRLYGDYIHNGPVTIGFTLTGKIGSSLVSAVNPDGVRTGNVRYALTQSNNIYAGYAATDFGQSTTYQKVTGRWMIPQAHCSPDENSLSAVWVGMTGGATDQSLLAQLGTISGCQSGVPQYFMWWEMFPAPSRVIDQSVQPGDMVTATVSFQNDEFQLTIDDPKEEVHFSTTQSGEVFDTSIVECIVEAPTIVDNLAPSQGRVAQLANFGTVSVSCQLNNNEPIAEGPQNIIYQMKTDAGVSKAITSDLDQAGTIFTVQWHHG